MQHYVVKADAANASSRCLSGSEHLCGRGNVPPMVAKTLYTALIDCHLIHGCEVVIDVHRPSLEKFVEIQKRCLRQILRVRWNSVIEPLFTELGVWPIGPRRLLLALRYLDYLISRDDDHLAWAALLQSYDLWKEGHSCWVGDLDLKLYEYTGLRLPLPEQWESNMLKSLKDRLYTCIIGGMRMRIHSIPRRFLLHDRLEPQEDPSAKIGVWCSVHHHQFLG
jgi:hypothetical protein